METTLNGNDMQFSLDSGSDLSFGISTPEYTGTMRPATSTTLGGIIVGEDLGITQQGVLSVIKANTVEQDNTHPITAAAVYMEIGNIDALLQTI